MIQEQKGKIKIFHTNVVVLPVLNTKPSGLAQVHSQMLFIQPHKMIIGGLLCTRGIPNYNQCWLL